MPPELTCDDVRDLAAAFVLGALDPVDEAAVREHLATCPEAHEEIAELGSVLPALDASVPQMEPSAGLKARVLAAAATDLEPVPVAGLAVAPTASSPAAAVPAPGAVPESAAAPIPFPAPTSDPVPGTRPSRRTSPLTWAVRIAAVLVIGVLAAWNLSLQGQVSTAQQYQQDVAAVITAAAQPGALTAVLTTEGGSGPAGVAAVASSGEVTMAMHDLAPTTGTSVYEAWAIGSDGVPMPLGSFDVGSAGTGSLQAAGPAPQGGMVLALTLEPAAGATTPTLPIVSSGTATAPG